MQRLINLALLLAFSIAYMEWGQGRSAFVFQAEYEIFANRDTLVETLSHPLVLSGLIGQLILVYCAVSRRPNRKVNWLGVAILSPVVLLIFLGGLLRLNPRLLASVAPFFMHSTAMFTSS